MPESAKAPETGTAPENNTHSPHTELVIGIHIGLCGVTISVKFHFIVYMPVGFSLLVYRAVEQEAT